MYQGSNLKIGYILGIKKHILSQNYKDIHYLERDGRERENCPHFKIINFDYVISNQY